MCIGYSTYAFKPRPGASPTGKLAKSPIRKEDKADIAAVVVIKSRWTSATQERYTSSLTHRSLVVQTHGPPLLDRMEALTAICDGNGLRIRERRNLVGLYDVRH